MGWSRAWARQTERTGLASDLELHQVDGWKAYSSSLFGQPLWVPVSPVPLTQRSFHLSVGQNYGPRPREGVLLRNDHQQGSDRTQGPLLSPHRSTN